MSVFNDYANYYDLLYQNKDYKSESEFILNLINKYAPEAKGLLNLGCGTGAHDIFFAKYGLDVDGVDLSADMLKMAENRKSQLNPSKDGKLNYNKADVRSFELNKKFDLITTLFHVVSYQTTKEDLDKMFQRVTSHINSGGVFIFDCWYGPCVINEKPEIRVKTAENDQYVLIRKATPTLDLDKDTVNVHYDLEITDKETSEKSFTTEDHLMRFIFPDEIENLLDKYGYKVLCNAEWMTDKEPDSSTWGVYWVVKKI